MLPYYEITLPLPPSVNAMHTVGKGNYNYKTRHTSRVVARSEEYTKWDELASAYFRNKFGPCGVHQLTGRLQAIYVFLWNKSDPGHLSSDVANREKCLTDFLEGKFFKNDNQLDDVRCIRRIVETGQNRAICRIYAIPDRRYDNPDLIFNPPQERL